MKLFLFNKAKRFGRDEEGAALVEFAMTIPILFIIFAVIIEGGRLFWGYQAVIAGVRDATRYVARAAPRDVCTAGGISAYQSTAERIVRTRMGAGNPSVFPGGIVVTSVVPSALTYTAPVGSTWAYRGGTVCVAQVTANIDVYFPFKNVFTLFGGGALVDRTSANGNDIQVTDEQRIYGT